MQFYMVVDSGPTPLSSPEGANSYIRLLKAKLELMIDATSIDIKRCIVYIYAAL